MHYLEYTYALGVDLHAKMRQDVCCLPLWPSIYCTAWEISKKGKCHHFL